MSRGQVLLLVLSGLMALSTFVHTFLAHDGWSRRERVAADLARVRVEIDAGEARAKDLREQIEALRTRPEVQERVVRDELGYVRPNDLVLELPKD